VAFLFLSFGGFSFQVSTTIFQVTFQSTRQTSLSQKLSTGDFLPQDAPWECQKIKEPELVSVFFYFYGSSKAEEKLLGFTKSQDSDFGQLAARRVPNFLNYTFGWLFLFLDFRGIQLSSTHHKLPGFLSIN
jgi:hypothetical protein